MPAPLTAPQCAAIYLMLLDDEDAARLLGQLDPKELELVGATMCELGEIAPQRIADALAGFVATAETDALDPHGRERKVGELLTRAVGDIRADGLMQRILPDAAPRAIEIARWLAPAIVAALVEEEHPQVVAVLLLLLDPEEAAQVLAALPQAAQPLVVECIARIGEVPADAIDLLDTLLSARLAQRYGSAALKLGGPRDAANLINLADPGMAREVIPAIEQRDSSLARAIEAEMFTFEMLLDLDPMAMGRLLRDVDNQHLVTALKGLPEAQQAPFFAAMSSRAADGVRDEIELLPKLRRADVLAAQKAIVDLARKLADDGEIQLGASDGEFV
jgi:flagellar motor switch protein FliG